MKKTYRRHSEEFKKEVTDYFLSSSKSITQICKEFTISPNQFYSWKQKILGDETNQWAVGEGVRGVPEDASPVQIAEEIRRLRKELTKSQRREDILKKAALILGNDPRNKLAQISTQKLSAWRESLHMHAVMRKLLLHLNTLMKHYLEEQEKLTKTPY